jgi:23S rRNA pseudouridine2605 synthase
VSDDQVDKMAVGIDIDNDGRPTLPCDVFVIDRKPDRTVLNFIIHEGRNRQIRKMCEAVGLEVIRLKRTEIAGVKMGMLGLGKWRDLNERELVRLQNISSSKQDKR